MEQNKISQFIKEIRRRNNLTQKQLADKYNVTYQAVSKWETGRNLPDTILLKQISRDFDISLDDIFEGQYNKKKKNKKRYMNITSVTLFILLIIAIVTIFNLMQNNHFEFKTISSNCKNFNISGSLSYNNQKSAIYIDNIEYQGNNNEDKYQKIECTLYEFNNGTEKIISSCNYNNTENITLDNFLQSVTFAIDNYSRLCKEYSQNSFYLEISATNEKNTTTYYKIPLLLEKNCQ